MEKSANPTVTVIGGSGFIGSKLIKKLGFEKCINIDKNQSAFFSNITTIGDIRNSDQIVFNKETNAVILLAAEHRDDVHPTSLYYDVNVRGTKNVLAKMDRNGIKHLIFTSSWLDIDLMNQAAQMLFKHTDFQCFSKVKTDVKTYNCTIMVAQWELDKNTLIFKIKADRFLRNMVRAIVGTMIEVGAKKRTLEEFHEIIASKNRSNAGTSAPAQGLYLINIEYPKSIYVH